MILITGATGHVGAYVLEYALAQNLPVRAASRNPTNPDWVTLDLSKPETFAAALSGVEKVFLYHPHTSLTQFLTAAKAAGVKLIVFLSSISVIMPDFPGTSNFIKKQHVDAEAEVTASGIPHVFLRPGEFCSNTINYANMIKMGKLLVPFPDALTCFIHERDIAEVAVAGLTRPEMIGTAVELTGNQDLDFDGVAKAFSKVLGKEVVVQGVTEELAKTKMIEKGMPELIVNDLLHYKKASIGNASPMTDSVEKILGKKPRTIEDYVAEHKASFV